MRIARSLAANPESRNLGIEIPPSARRNLLLAWRITF
jgi:hypothetical protein